LEDGAVERVGFTLKVYDAEEEALVNKFGVVEKGITALEAMESLVPVEYSTSEYGAFVTSINGVTPGEGHYWALYVDGEYATQGISAYILEENMSVEWKLEELTDFGLS
jgi:hypothetical protein